MLALAPRNDRKGFLVSPLNIYGENPFPFTLSLQFHDISRLYPLGTF
jgi:hypothetical protein